LRHAFAQPRFSAMNPISVTLLHTYGPVLSTFVAHPWRSRRSFKTKHPHAKHERYAKVYKGRHLFT
jgi:hypothetical protein